jgi:hypothetical protein
MKPTNKITHFKNGGNSVLGLPVFQDDTGAEFVNHQGRWVHVQEMPLPRTHTVGISSTPAKRVPTFVRTPVAPDLPAFKPTSSEQRTARKVLKPEW